ncbi:YaaR family protein [Rossellomorea sp. BNER]|uniref:YaaR family protein n=1 Tax=Rossellomorea sp. BNER TaxID=2962031 RepID=UPI003AF2DB58|nr:YaaR family protein [Rossellomorea sp. BNER]
MKINQELRVGVDKFRQDQKTNPLVANKFGALVQKQNQKMKVEHLGRLLSDIEVAGERLSRSRTFKDLAKYKTLVKRFLKEAVDYGMDLKESHTWNQFGEGRKLTIIETVDEMLIQLSEGLIQKEKESIDILGKLGEIKGLLINLYM